MTFNEPILALLPASEVEILSAYRGVYPDSVLARLRRLEKASVVKKRKDGKYVKASRPKDKPLITLSDRRKNPVVNGKRKNPVNKSQLRERKCTECGTVYLGVVQHFGDHRSKVCISCVQKRPPGFHGNSKGKVCARCGEFRFPLGKQFREVRKNCQKVWTNICNTCWNGG